MARDINKVTWDGIDISKIKYDTSDPVNHPSHYTKGNIECIDAIQASMTKLEFRGYLKGNILKYIWRYESKGKPVEDLTEAHWYLHRLLDEVHGGIDWLSREDGDRDEA